MAKYEVQVACVFQPEETEGSGHWNTVSFDVEANSIRSAENYAEGLARIQFDNQCIVRTWIYYSEKKDKEDY